MRASPSRVSGMSVGCLRPNERSEFLNRPPTLIRLSSVSTKGDMLRMALFFWGGSLLIDSIPLGHASLCMLLCRFSDVDWLSLVSVWFPAISSIRLAHSVPDEIASVAWLALCLK